MAADLQNQHPRDVLSDQSCRAAHEGGQRHHQYRIRQLGDAKSHSACLCYDQGADPELYRRTRQLLAEKGIRANAVAPGPIWTLLIPSTMPEDAVKNFGMQVPVKRAGQPAELETAYVMLADPLSG
jgi:hypothetical protein